MDINAALNELQADGASPRDILLWAMDFVDEELEELMFSDPVIYAHTYTNIHFLATEARAFLTEAAKRLRKMDVIERDIEKGIFRDKQG
jgi:hypothetical protein